MLMSARRCKKNGCGHNTLRGPVLCEQQCCVGPLIPELTFIVVVVLSAIPRPIATKRMVRPDIPVLRAESRELPGRSASNRSGSPLAVNVFLSTYRWRSGSSLDLAMELTELAEKDAAELRQLTAALVCELRS